MSEPTRRRKRAAISCSLCRKRKIRCNRELPCSNCTKSRNGVCIYSDTPYDAIHMTDPNRTGEPRHSRSVRSRNSATNTGDTLTGHQSTSMTTVSTPSSAHGSHLSRAGVDPVKGRNIVLEERPLRKPTSRETPPSGLTSMDLTSSRITEPFHVYHDRPSHHLPHPIVRGVMHKTRLFGKSNWINGVTLFLETIETIDVPSREKMSNAITSLQKCKSLGRVIKRQRGAAWPSSPSATLPTKEVTDELVDRYRRTIESVYRIIHIPTFTRDYEAFWTSTREGSSGFMVQLKLVLAIGAATFDEHFSMRAAAIRWIYEAQAWLSEPEFKSRLSIQALQNSLLFSLAREAAGIGANLVWVSIGSILRTAVHMGLHRDPRHLQIKSVFAAEMRRRLWNTIIELNLLSSLASGSPPLMSMEDFDTEPPRNLDDDQLEAEDPVAKHEDDFTQVSVPIALRKSFPVRLAVIKFLNDLSSQGTYDETIRLDAELRDVCKSLQRALSKLSTAATPSPITFEVGFVDILLHRFISALHVPFFELSIRESRYAYSRRVAVDSSLKIWCTAYPNSKIQQLSRGSYVSHDADMLHRLAICGAGFLRTTVIQASFLIAVELRTQLQDGDGLGPIPIRTDLLSVLEDSKEWTFRCIEAGETNIKGHLLLCAVAAHIDGLMQGLEEDEISDLLIKTMEDVGGRCLQKLEDIAAKNQAGSSQSELDRIFLDTQAEPPEDWDFMKMTDDVFSFGTYEYILE